ncbi:sugar ABC transporter substrate-binding protein [Rhodococcus sp. ADH]|uniref:FecCD family ABC transporter permease n=1 Tax=unclassified Rhodococcus (in: high G+C Gram-positive bacteria) TaxID=192944 RepID=UPI0006BA5635|nr:MULTISPECIES: iron ABC transporter permease [unclassified Rhodococcus (in: high G+C Gram-positive bacteria)]KPH20767.1 sugar ABC transporter substrate-binding protein [Rhodococcus sp. ADH]RGP48030.1 sugar ABC transporter substrate-binding protein [Rhodococcus erythropolis]
MRRTSVTALTVTCAVALLVVSVIALMLGTAHIPWREVCSIIWAELSGGTVTAVELPNYRIIIDSRLPRVLLAIVIGAGLSAVGLVVQAMVRNALADPYVLGISSGASVGATLVVLFGAFGALGIYALSTAAFAGALAATFLVYLMARSSVGLIPLRLVLTGTALGYGFSAITTVLVFLAPHGDSARSVMFWLLGSLSAATWQMVPLAVTVAATGLGIIAVCARRLNALAMGDEVSAALGLDASKFRLLLFVVAAAMTGCFVSICGAVGFVGLVVPHVARMMVGADHTRLIVVTPVLGAVFLVSADLLARTVVPPQELPLGAITAAVGVPVFVLLMRRRGALMGAG